MKQEFTLFHQKISLHSVVIRALAGGILAFILIYLVVTSVDDPDPAWPSNWMMRPLLLTPFIAACGAASTCVLDGWRKKGGWNMVAALLLSLIVYTFSLWIGTVLGLDGTLWN